jgi:hypothetical protein
MTRRAHSPLRSNPPAEEAITPRRLSSCLEAEGQCHGGSYHNTEIILAASAIVQTLPFLRSDDACAAKDCLRETGHPSRRSCVWRAWTGFLHPR